MKRRANLEILQKEAVVLERERVEDVEPRLLRTPDQLLPSFQTVAESGGESGAHLLRNDHRVSDKTLEPDFEDLALVGRLVAPVDDGRRDAPVAEVAAGRTGSRGVVVEVRSVNERVRLDLDRGGRERVEREHVRDAVRFWVLFMF